MANNLTLSISQLNNYIKNIFDAEEMLQGISVFGELTNYKISNGVAYFDIKDESSQLACVMFSGFSSSSFKTGDKVLLTGRMNYHIRLGRLSFVASKIEMYGQGELYKKYLELKNKLEKEGLFDESIKIPIPKFSKGVGVISSETGAVIHDIINVARRKNPYMNIYLFPVKVQGVGADDDIAKAISILDNFDKVDIIIIARGGGSFEDLAPFNSEKVARAVFACSKPVISGVGHETDFSLCDFASDLRAPTPSVASDLAVFNYFDTNKYINDCISRCLYQITNKDNSNKMILNNNLQKIHLLLKSQLDTAQNNIIRNCSNIYNCLSNRVIYTHNKLDKLSIIIEKINPMYVLRKGFSRVSVGDNIVKSIGDVKVGDSIVNTLVDGKIVSVINSVSAEGK